MTTELRPALVSLALMTVLTGVIYPLVVTGVAQMLFPPAANGSLIVRDGRPVGSALIGQPFDEPKYFWGRPSTTEPFSYNAAASSGSNLGPSSEALLAAAKRRVDALRAADPGNAAPIPVDLVTASASGLDPHVSPAAARWQIGRVARARGVDARTVETLVAEHTTGRQWGFLGEPTVNVLMLNLALDAPQALALDAPRRWRWMRRRRWRWMRPGAGAGCAQALALDAPQALALDAPQALALDDALPARWKNKPP
jgi:K+-transporting ATPase ATPase C chain